MFLGFFEHLLIFCYDVGIWKNNRLSQSWVLTLCRETFARLEVLGPLKPFLVFSFPRGLPAKFTVLRCRDPHLFSSVSKLPPVLSVPQVRNQSLGQPPDKPEHWMLGPFFCLQPQDEGFPSGCSIILHRERGINSCAKCRWYS